jgi:hypothetical protein
MQTILDVSSEKKEWLVRLSAGMPGGIGDTGFECGGVTSPLVLLGIATVAGRSGFLIWRNYRQHFLAYHKTLHCHEIRGNDCPLTASGRSPLAGVF